MIRTSKGLLILLCCIIMFTSIKNIFVVGCVDAYSSEDTISYGFYPQSLVKDDKIINALNSAPKKWVSYNYYTIKDHETKVPCMSDCAKYCDVEYPIGSNTYFRGVIFTQYRSNCTTNADWQEPHQLNSGYKLNEIYWFIWEPLNWVVLNHDTGLVVCKEIIDAQPFNTKLIRTDDDYYIDEQSIHYANNYETSSIREWLTSNDSNSFLNLAFQKNEIDLIYTTHLINEGYDESYNCISTNDKIFLLSYEDGFSQWDFDFDVKEPTKMVGCTDYSKSQGVPWFWFEDAESDLYGNGYYLLRNAGVYYSYYVCAVNESGTFHTNYESNQVIGVRPAMCVNIEAIKNRAKSVSVSDKTVQYKSKEIISPTIDIGSDTEYTTIFESSNPNIVEVDSFGNILTHGIGKSTITVTVVDQYENQVSDSCVLTIYYTWWQKLIRILLLGFIWY